MIPWTPSMQRDTFVTLATSLLMISSNFVESVSATNYGLRLTLSASRNLDRHRSAAESMVEFDSKHLSERGSFFLVCM